MTRESDLVTCLEEIAADVNACSGVADIQGMDPATTYLRNLERRIMSAINVAKIRRSPLVTFEGWRVRITSSKKPV